MIKSCSPLQFLVSRAKSVTSFQSCKINPSIKCLQEHDVKCLSKILPIFVPLRKITRYGNFRRIYGNKIKFAEENFATLKCSYDLSCGKRPSGILDLSGHTSIGESIRGHVSVRVLYLCRSEFMCRSQFMCRSEHMCRSE